MVKESLIPPHGGHLVNLLVDDDRATELKESSRNLISWDLTERQICDIELLINGGFSPLDGFMCRDDYEAVCTTMRLKDSTIWPVSVVLDLPEEIVGTLKISDRIALRDPEGLLIAVLNVQDIWQPDRMAEAEAVYGTTNREHPGVFFLLERMNPWYAGGKIEALQLPEHYDFRPLRMTPEELRHSFVKLGWRKILAFQTHGPMHREHFEMTRRAAGELRANLLIHPVVGMKTPGDVDHYTRIRCYEKILPRYPKDTAMLSLLPLSMRFAGVREALWHAIIRKNHGCTHFLVDRNYASSGKGSKERLSYGSSIAQEVFSKYEKELEIQMVSIRKMVCAEDTGGYFSEGDVPDGRRVLSMSGMELRNRLMIGADIPEWFTFPEIVEELRKTYPPRYKQGFTIFFTGLSGAGKSTIAKGVLSRLLEMGGRPVTLLDGDIVRKNLSSELGFSKEHRDINIKRIGFVASEITKNGGIAICAPIAPYDKIRKEVRNSITPVGGFVLVYVSTPLEVCELRDRKGLYAKARAGIIKDFTGISDPYEPPEDAEIVIDTTDLTPEEEVQKIILHLEREGYIAGR